jgi:Tol biopolymer transport system component
LLLRPAQQRPHTWSATDLRTVSSDPGSERRPAVSPDGTRVVYAQFDSASGFDRLVMRAIGQSQSVRVTAKAAGFEEVPAWSPDGTQIAFERLAGDGCTVHIVPSLGGPERDVGTCRDHNTHYFDWTPDGQGLITADRPADDAASMALVRWDLATGAKQPLHYARAAGDQDLEAHYSPDGRWLAFRRGLAPYSDLWVMDPAGGNVRQVTQLHSRIRGYAWTPDSAGLVVSSNHEGRFTLYSVALRDGAVRALGVGPAEYPNAARNHDSIAYEIPRTTNRLAWVRLGVDNAIPELLAKSTGSDASPALSPDGNRVAFVSDRSGTPQVWLYDFAANAATALTDYRDALLLVPCWSADGQRLLVTVRGRDPPGLVEIDMATRRQRVVSAAADDVLAGSYGPDADSYLLVLGARGEQNRLVLVQRAGSAQETRTQLATGVEHAEADLAGRRVYFTSNARHGLFVRDLAGSTDAAPVTSGVDAGMMDGWRVVDGRIWYVAKVAWKPTDLVEFDPATGATRTVGHFDTELHDVAFSVTPARDRVVIVPLGVEDTDVGAFRIGSAR